MRAPEPNPALKPLLDQLRSQAEAQEGADQRSPETIAATRQGYDMLGGLTVRPEPPPAVDERTVPGPAGDLRVRLYTPRATEAPPPVLVYLHGGGWTIGSLESHDGLCQQLAVGGRCLVVSVDYRLAPEHPFPAALEDAWAATRWVAAHAGALGGDPSRLAVGGDSAGGNLAAVIARRARDGGGPDLALQLLLYPAVDRDLDRPSMRENGEGYLLTLEGMRAFWENYLGGREELARDPDVCPLRADDLSGLPPAFVLTCGYDPLRDEGIAYARRLAEAGVPVTHRNEDDQIHAFLQLSMLVPTEAGAVYEALGGALRDAFAT